MRGKIKFSNIFRSTWHTHTGHGDWDARSSTERNFHGGNALAQQQKSGSLTNRFLTMWSVADESYAHETNQLNERFDGRNVNFLLTKVAFALISNWCWNAFPILMAHWGKIHAILVWHTIDAVAAVARDASAFVAIRWCFQQALSIETTIVLNITRRRQADALLNAIADISFRAQAIRHTLDVVPLTDGIFGTIGSVTESARNAAAKKCSEFHFGVGHDVEFRILQIRYVPLESLLADANAIIAQRVLRAILILQTLRCQMTLFTVAFVTLLALANRFSDHLVVDTCSVNIAHIFLNSNTCCYFHLQLTDENWTYK